MRDEEALFNRRGTGLRCSLLYSQLLLTGLHHFSFGPVRLHQSPKRNRPPLYTPLVFCPRQFRLLSYIAVEPLLYPRENSLSPFYHFFLQFKLPFLKYFFSEVRIPVRCLSVPQEIDNHSPILQGSDLLLGHRCGFYFMNVLNCQGNHFWRMMNCLTLKILSRKYYSDSCLETHFKFGGPFLSLPSDSSAVELLLHNRQLAGRFLQFVFYQILVIAFLKSVQFSLHRRALP